MRTPLHTCALTHVVQNLTYIFLGLNCGRDEIFPGGYDWFPCQHERWQVLEDGSWINQISFCMGADNKCLSRGGGAGIRTIANVTLHRPGVIRHEYDSALAPQVIIIASISANYLGLGINTQRALVNEA